MRRPIPSAETTSGIVSPAFDLWAGGRHKTDLHGGQDTDGVSGLDLGSLLDSDLDHDTGHGGTDAAGFASRLVPGDLGNGGLTILDDDHTGLGVDLEEALSGTRVLVDLADGEKLDDEQLSGLDLNVHLFVDDGLAEEVSGGDDTEVAVLFEESLELLENLVASKKVHVSSPCDYIPSPLSILTLGYM